MNSDSPQTIERLENQATIIADLEIELGKLKDKNRELNRHNARLFDMLEAALIKENN